VTEPVHARSRDVNEAAIAPSVEVPHARGEELVFDRLYRENRDDLYAYVAGLLRDRGAAEEVTAAAFERAYRKRSRFNPRRGSARAWLFGIARNAALDELRRRGRNARMNGEPIDSADLGVAHRTEAGELRLALQQALDGLAPRERELVALRFFAGLSNGEIARVIGTSESNVGTRLHRTMDKLREALSEDA
jgi:RNA polymerase sigma-70 factor, ECF subfamily